MARRWQPSSTSRSKYGRPANWHKIRAATLRRDGMVCRECGGPGNIVDHIVSYAQGGSDDAANLQVLCLRHHNVKTSREANAAKPKRKREPERHPGLL